MATYTNRQQLKIRASYSSARKEKIEAVVAALWGQRVSKGLQSCRSELTLFAADFEAINHAVCVHRGVTCAVVNSSRRRA